MFALLWGEHRIRVEKGNVTRDGEGRLDSLVLLAAENRASLCVALVYCMEEDGVPSDWAAATADIVSRVAQRHNQPVCLIGPIECSKHAIAEEPEMAGNGVLQADAALEEKLRCSALVEYHGIHDDYTRPRLVPAMHDPTVARPHTFGVPEYVCAVLPYMRDAQPRPVNMAYATDMVVEMVTGGTRTGGQPRLVDAHGCSQITLANMCVSTRDTSTSGGEGCAVRWTRAILSDDSRGTHPTSVISYDDRVRRGARPLLTPHSDPLRWLVRASYCSNYEDALHELQLTPVPTRVPVSVARSYERISAPVNGGKPLTLARALAVYADRYTASGASNLSSCVTSGEQPLPVLSVVARHRAMRMCGLCVVDESGDRGAQAVQCAHGCPHVFAFYGSDPEAASALAQIHGVESHVTWRRKGGVLPYDVCDVVVLNLHTVAADFVNAEGGGLRGIECGDSEWSKAFVPAFDTIHNARYKCSNLVAVLPPRVDILVVLHELCPHFPYMEIEQVYVAGWLDSITVYCGDIWR